MIKSKETIRLEIKDATGAWILDIHANESYTLTYQEVSVDKAKWRCLVAEGSVNESQASLKCLEHNHKLPVSVIETMHRVLGLFILHVPPPLGMNNGNAGKS